MLYFFFNDTATTEIYTLSLHDALPILWKEQQSVRGYRSSTSPNRVESARLTSMISTRERGMSSRDRKSTRLNSSHSQISYAVFCLKKKKRKTDQINEINHIATKDRRPD